MAKFEFPSGFFWGAATSAHQVEGDNHNDWSEWELKNAERLSCESGKKYPPENYISGQACDHYNRFREDFDIAKSLSHNAHRFSIEWSRIEPEEGKWDEKEIAHYQEVVNSLRERGIEPFLTLYHWTLPLWIKDQGSWKNKKTVSDFARFVDKITKNILRVKFWIILNEPLVYAKFSFRDGVWPPQHKSWFSYFIVIHNLIAAHKKAYNIIKKFSPESCVGVAHNMSSFMFRGVFINKLLAKFGAWQKNFYFINSLKNYLDFVGYNCYSHYIVNWDFTKTKGEYVSDMDWEIYPKGIYYLLKDLKKYNKPIYITENGLADAKDEKRAKFIKEHAQWMARAMNEGADVRGYFHWSLLDNFEWDKGFWPRFGLVEMDYKTMERKIHPSAYEYKNIIEVNSIEI